MGEGDAVLHSYISLFSGMAATSESVQQHSRRNVMFEGRLPKGCGFCLLCPSCSPACSGVEKMRKEHQIISECSSILNLMRMILYKLRLLARPLQFPSDFAR